MLATTNTATATGVDADRVADLRAHPVCRRIKAAVLAVEPEAEVLLFGSRARGDAREDSDWDVLVLLGDEVTFARDAAITRALYRAFEPGEQACATAIVRPKSQWSVPRQATHFLRNIAADAIAI